MGDVYRYSATLSGADIDLRLLAHCFTTDDCRVSIADHEDGNKSYVLRSTKLELEARLVSHISTDSDGKAFEVVLDSTIDNARDVADNLLRVMNGAAKLVRDVYKPVSIEAIHKCTLDGIWMGSATVTSMGDVGRNYAMPPTHTGLAELVRLWVLKGFEDESASFALSVLGTLPLSWTMLYMVYEVIREDSPDLTRWISNSQLKEFTKAANNARDLREGPRHAKAGASERLMTLQEANGVVRHLLNHWLGSKVGRVMK